jgi:hypothetical protein
MALRQASVVLISEPTERLSIQIIDPKHVGKRYYGTVMIDFWQTRGYQIEKYMRKQMLNKIKESSSHQRQSEKYM